MKASRIPHMRLVGLLTGILGIMGCQSAPVIVKGPGPSIETLGHILVVDLLNHFRTDIQINDFHVVTKYNRDGTFEAKEYAEGAGTGEPEIVSGRNGTYQYDPSRLNLTQNIYANYSRDEKRWIRTGDRVLETLSSQVFLGEKGHAEVYVLNGTEWVNMSVWSHIDFDDRSKSMKKLIRKAFSLAEGPSGYRSTYSEQLSVDASEPYFIVLSEETADSHFVEETPALSVGEPTRIRLTAISSRRQEYNPATRMLGEPILAQADPEASRDLQLLSMQTYLVSLM